MDKICVAALAERKKEFTSPPAKSFGLCGGNQTGICADTGRGLAGKRLIECAGHPLEYALQHAF